MLQKYCETCNHYWNFNCRNNWFKAWTELPKSIAVTAIAEIRKRKGLAPEPPGIDEYIDRE